MLRSCRVQFQYVLPCKPVETPVVLCGNGFGYTTNCQGVDAVSQEEGVVCEGEAGGLVGSQCQDCPQRVQVSVISSQPS